LAFHPAHRYDAAFRLKLSPLLWATMIHGLRHALFLLAAGTPAALLFDSDWMHLQSTWMLLPSDALAGVVLLAAGHRVAGAKPAMRRLWHAGRHVLMAAHAVDLLLFGVLRRDVLANPDASGFGAAVLVLVVDAAVLLFLARSRLVRDIFADFPEITDGQGAGRSPAESADADAASPSRRGVNAMLPATGIMPGAAAVSFAWPTGATTDECIAFAARLHADGRLADAESVYRHVLGVAPDRADAWHGFGMLAVQAERLDAAALLVGQAIRCDGTVPLYHRNFGEICRRLGRIGEAIGAGQIAVRLAPDDAEAHFNLALAQADGGRLDDAIESCRRALAIHPRHGAAWNNLGVLLRRQGDHASARRAFETALAIDPTHRQAIDNLEGPE
jgi:Flp pilus assembly protein TadD